MSKPEHYSNNRPQPEGEPYFPPPPTGAYGDDAGYQNPQGYDQRPPPNNGASRPPYGGQQADSYDQHAPPPRSEQGYGDVDDRAYDNVPRNAHRPYAPSEPRPNDGNMLAPYDEEKAYAEYTEAYGPPYGQEPEHGGGARRREEEYERRRYEEERRRYEEEKRRYEQREYERERDRPRDRRDEDRYDDRHDARYDDRYDDRYKDRYDSRPPRDDRDRRYSDRYDDGARLQKKRSPTERPRGKDLLRQGDGERGIGATLLGGAAGAFLGNEMDKGALGTLGGALVGAIGANVVEKQVDKRNLEKDGKRRAQSQYEGSVDSYYGSRGPAVRGESFRPKREGRRDRGPRRGRHGSSSDDYASDY